ncbi:hypothetical protein CYMTET_29577 [Cymbomonas tetramitiformis]|uniref:LITAF domain-containing protein n=1 Tax=Cymbomonas tetramitiformis TaxID=36881 RepID=A0AAE0FKH1_9CHLO|nr:hypothetical protein CYMTET_29577 [Cymbomonas tetramitiformis]
MPSEHTSESQPIVDKSSESGSSSQPSIPVAQPIHPSAQPPLATPVNQSSYQQQPVYGVPQGAPYGTQPVYAQAAYGQPHLVPQEQYTVIMQAPAQVHMVSGPVPRSPFMARDPRTGREAVTRVEKLPSGCGWITCVLCCLVGVPFPCSLMDCGCGDCFLDVYHYAPSGALVAVSPAFR